MDRWHPEEVGPSDLQHRFLVLKEPDLMLVALVVGRTAQFCRWSPEAEAVLADVVVEDADFLVEIGRTALKARNCFTAAS